MATNMKQHAEPATTARSQLQTDSSAADAISLLKSDHRLVEDLFEQLESASGSQKQQLVRKLCQELTVHAALEENFFYPQAGKVLGKETDLLDEAKVEHASLKWLIAQLETEATSTELYDAKIKVLQEYVQHHVKEEEKELFPKLKKSSLDLMTLGENLATAKADLQKLLYH